MLKERIKEFFEPESSRKTRREYKYAILQPHFNKLPLHVIEVMLDHDLSTLDVLGNKTTVPYEIKLKTGEVKKIINRVFHRDTLSS